MQSSGFMHRVILGDRHIEIILYSFCYQQLSGWKLIKVLSPLDFQPPFCVIRLKFADGGRSLISLQLISIMLGFFRYTYDLAMGKALRKACAAPRGSGLWVTLHGIVL